MSSVAAAVPAGNSVTSQATRLPLQFLQFGVGR